MKFIGILPDWNEISRGLNAIVLTHGDEEEFGYHIPGSVHIRAWNREMWIAVTDEYYAKTADLLGRLGVPSEFDGSDGYLCKFTEETARGLQLLDTFLHELGHHHDRMTTKSKTRPSRGEPYAEAYAKKV